MGHAYQLFCVAHVPEAQGSLPWVEDYCTYAYQPRACHTHRTVSYAVAPQVRASIEATI